jgi:hypothetical protein
MKAPAHLHVAVRIMDRCGVDDAVVGDILEVYEAHPSALRVWREVAGALMVRLATHVRDNKPQTIRRLGTVMTALCLVAYVLSESAHIDLATSVRVEDVSGGWSVTTAADGRTRLLPTVSFHLRNVSTGPLASVQVNVIFRRVGDRDVWSDVVRHAITARALASGIATEPIVAQAPIGYTGDDGTSSLLKHAQFVDSAVSIYARHGAEQWTYLGEYPLPRQIVSLDMSPHPVTRGATPATEERVAANASGDLRPSRTIHRPVS